MARLPQVPREQLIALVQSRGPVSATELAASLGINRTTVVRALADLGNRIAVFGHTRSTRYAVRRPIRNAGDHWPVYRMDEAGQGHAWGTLESLHGRRAWRMNWVSKPPEWALAFSDASGLWDGFPFFLGDQRPQGFIGREIARQVSPILQVPDHPAAWSDADTLIYLQAAGVDLPGNLITGDECLRQAQSQAMMPQAANLLTRADRALAWPQRAALVTQILPGSSAGGEQPKFLANLREPDEINVSPVLVKFSARMDQPAGERWGDLLLAEYYAHQILAGQGLALPGAEIHDFEQRRFLELPRFDRTPGGGRRGVISLAAIHDSAVGRSMNHWPTAVGELLDLGLTDSAALETSRRLQAFGSLIGNTDMHHGNLAFWLTDALPFRLAPVFDMLPMNWAPGPQGEIVDRPFLPALPLPSEREAWQETASWAVAFWENLLADSRLTETFRAIAGTALHTVRHLRERLLPA